MPLKQHNHRLMACLNVAGSFAVASGISDSLDLDVWCAVCESVFSPLQEKSE